MQDLNDKVTGGSLSAAEWNEVPSEIQNVIENLGIALSGADLNQLGKGIAGYVANSNFYTDSGAADAYVLSKIGLKQTLPAYTDGMEVKFLPGNDNTGASTVNVAGLGVKNIVNTATASVISDGRLLTLRYRIGSGDFEIVPVGIVQAVNVQDGAVATGTTTVPIDDTIPQNTEGDEYMTLAITPKNAANILVIEVIAAFANTTGQNFAMSLFKDATANALATMADTLSIANDLFSIALRYEIVAGSLATTTFKIRAGGGGAGTTTFNGISGTRRYGGVIASSITITEIAP